jgi:protease IV
LSEINDNSCRYKILISDFIKKLSYYFYLRKTFLNIFRKLSSTITTNGGFMKRICSLFVLFCSIPISVFAQSSVTPYYSRNDFQLASPGAMKFGLYGYDNPALLSYVREPDLLFTWSDQTGKWNDFNRWGLFAAVPHFGFGVVHNHTAIGNTTNYTLSLGAGDRSFSSGISYNWTGTSNTALDKSDLVSLGALARPMPFLSVGANYTSAVHVKGWEAVGEVAVRPLGSELVTVFGDYVLHRMPLPHQDLWSAGVAVEALPGMRIIGRYFDSKAFNLGFQFSFGTVGVETQSHYNTSGKYSYNTYGVRLGAYDRTVLNKIFPPEKKYVGIDLNGPIDYQRYEFFDNTKTLSGILSLIDAAERDPDVAGIAINTSGMSVNREKLWEVREKLKEFKSKGKKVIIFIDRGNIDLLHFASVADKIVMDPIGSIMLDGYLLGNTYLKGTLEKIGIGFEEWRFFKYKSAMESLSRDHMSDADREQRQKIADDWYSIAKTDICEGRKISPELFDSLTNSVVIFLAPDAQKYGLIDSIGRWDVVDNIVKAETGSDNGYTSAKGLSIYHKPYDARWGEPPKIAVIYALGACAMDEGIKARSLVHVLEGAVNDSRIKAIVLRVDSPGGDGMASDYISEAMRKAKGKKPIIVSQGFVAGSGGYWLSMYGDTIVAAPGTITGSIGVIGGWVYNKSLKESLGMSTDFVKAGEHADLGFGFRLPLIGLGVPDRNLTPDEFGKMEITMKTMYKEFVAKVSDGRKLRSGYVDSIGQGRIWSGLDGKKNGLVDVIGGMERAIAIAKERAGIPNDQEVTIVEMPKKGLFNFGALMPNMLPFGMTSTSDPTIDLVKFRLEHNGEVMPMMPLEDAAGLPVEK